MQGLVQGSFKGGVEGEGSLNVWAIGYRAYKGVFQAIYQAYNASVKAAIGTSCPGKILELEFRQCWHL